MAILWLFEKECCFYTGTVFTNHLYSSTFGIVLDWLNSDEFRCIDMNLKQCTMIRTYTDIILLVFLSRVRITSTGKSKREVCTTSQSAFKIPNVSSGWFFGFCTRWDWLRAIYGFWHFNKHFQGNMIVHLTSFLKFFTSFHITLVVFLNCVKIIYTHISKREGYTTSQSNF